MIKTIDLINSATNELVAKLELHDDFANCQRPICSLYAFYKDRPEDYRLDKIGVFKVGLGSRELVFESQNEFNESLELLNVDEFINNLRVQAFGYIATAYVVEVLRVEEELVTTIVSKKNRVKNFGLLEGFEIVPSSDEGRKG